MKRLFFFSSRPIGFFVRNGRRIGGRHRWANWPLPSFFFTGFSTGFWKIVLQLGKNLGFDEGFFWCLFKVYWVLLGFYWYLTGFYWVLPSFPEFYRFLPASTRFTGFYWVLLGFTGFYWVWRCGPALKGPRANSRPGRDPLPSPRGPLLSAGVQWPALGRRRRTCSRRGAAFRFGIDFAFFTVSRRVLVFLFFVVCPPTRMELLDVVGGASETLRWFGLVVFLFIAAISARNLCLVSFLRADHDAASTSATSVNEHRTSGVSSGFSWFFFWVWLGSTGFYRVWLAFYRVLPGFTWFYWILLAFIGFYRVSLGLS